MIRKYLYKKLKNNLKYLMKFSVSHPRFYGFLSFIVFFLKKNSFQPPPKKKKLLKKLKSKKKSQVSNYFSIFTKDDQTGLKMDYFKSG